jgi:hypothetical protein
MVKESFLGLGVSRLYRIGVGTIKESFVFFSDIYIYMHTKDCVLYTPEGLRLNMHVRSVFNILIKCNKLKYTLMIILFFLKGTS